MVVNVVKVVKQRGIGLVELLIATAIGALLFAGLTSVAREGVQARSITRDASEAVYQARFALQRISAAAKAAAPHTLLAPAANTSGDWFGTVLFCVNGTGSLIETTTADTGCTGTQVIAQRISSFGVALPSGAGPLESATAVITLALTGPGGGSALTMTESVRLGGGVQ